APAPLLRSLVLEGFPADPGPATLANEIAPARLSTHHARCCLFDVLDRGRGGAGRRARGEGRRARGGAPRHRARDAPEPRARHPASAALPSSARDTPVRPCVPSTISRTP